MKFALHARSLHAYSKGCYYRLLEHILDNADDWICVVPDDINTVEKEAIQSRLAKGRASRQWPCIPQTALPDHSSIVCFAVPENDDPICTRRIERSQLLVAYEPFRDDDDATHLQTLQNWNVDRIFTPATSDELPIETSESQEAFFRLKRLYLPPSIEIERETKRHRYLRDTLYIIDRTAPPSMKSTLSYPEQWPGKAPFAKRLEKWTSILEESEMYPCADAERYSPKTVIQIAECQHVVGLSEDPSFCQAIALASAASNRTWTLFSGEFTSPIGFAPMGIAAHLDTLIPAEKTKLRSFFGKILAHRRSNRNILSPTRLERILEQTQPKRQLSILCSALGSPTNGAAIGEQAQSSAASNENLLQAWEPLWEEIKAKRLSIPGLRRFPAIHQATANGISLDWQEHYAKGLLFARDETSPLWLEHFSACVRHYPKFIECCEAVLLKFRNAGLKRFLAGGEYWATNLAHLIFAAHETNIHSPVHSQALQNSSRSALLLLKHDLDLNRPRNYYFFSLLLWSAFSNDPASTIQTAENATNPLRVEVPQVACLLANGKMKHLAKPLMDTLPDSFIEEISETNRILYAAVACGRTGRLTLAQQMLNRLFITHPTLLIEEQKNLGFDPASYIAPLFYATGETDFALRLFDRACLSQPALQPHKQYFFSEIPKISNLEIPAFSRPQ